MAHDDDGCNQVLNEVEAVFSKHNVVGVVSFVRLSNVQRVDCSKKSFDMDGGAGVIMGVNEDDACVAMALDYVAGQQEHVVDVLHECHEEVKNRVKWARSAN